MEILWAPWRMAYIAGDASAGEPETDPSPPANPQSAILNPQSPGCIFCRKIAQAPDADQGNLILLRGAQTFVILNLYPYNSGHLMIVPYRHLADVTALTPDENADIMATLQRMVLVLGRVYHPE